jgi:hypothetical protein
LILVEVILSHPEVAILSHPEASRCDPAVTDTATDILGLLAVAILPIARITVVVPA